MQSCPGHYLYKLAIERHGLSAALDETVEADECEKIAQSSPPAIEEGIQSSGFRSIGGFALNHTPNIKRWTEGSMLQL
eukprot:4134457-Amphidinium_carterae.1